VPRRGKGIEFLADTFPNLRRKLEPLTGCGRRKSDLPHDINIAQCDMIAQSKLDDATADAE
jgi:hypothetical protein